MTKENLPLDKTQIIKNLTHQECELELFETINSTSTYLNTLSHSKTPHICLAETQTQGRGRFAHQWHSPFGKNIYLSLRYFFHKNIHALSGLSLAVGLAICDAIESLYALPIPLTVKWPNDILADEKKLAGCLIEIQVKDSHHISVIIGIGLNVHMLEDAEHNINQVWTSLQKISGHLFDRNLLCASMIDHLLEAMQQFEQHGLAYFLPAWQKKDALAYKTIQLQSGDSTFQGTAMGVDEQGHLRIQFADGREKLFASGDTRLIKTHIFR